MSHLLQQGPRLCRNLLRNPYLLTGGVDDVVREQRHHRLPTLQQATTYIVTGSFAPTFTITSGLNVFTHVRVVPHIRVVVGDLRPRLPAHAGHGTPTPPPVTESNWVTFCATPACGPFAASRSFVIRSKSRSEITSWALRPRLAMALAVRLSFCALNSAYSLAERGRIPLLVHPRVFRRRIRVPCRVNALAASEGERCPFMFRPSFTGRRLSRATRRGESAHHVLWSRRGR